MPRTRQGSIVVRDAKAIWARVTYLDETGKRREKWRRAENRSHARELIKDLLRELEEYGEQSLDSTHMTFAQLADYYRDHYAIEPQYSTEGRKIAGLRSFKTVREQLKMLRDYFEKQKVRSITHGGIQKFKLNRLATETKQHRPRSIARVNRELALLRRILSIAHREGWILRNPFTSGDSLISVADEQRRERILSPEEESKLLNACTGRCSHLRPIIVCALDTGMRQGEMLKLRWSDIDFENETILVRAFNTKVMRERILAMTPRLKSELSMLYPRTLQNSDALIFGIKNNVKRSFSTVRKAIGLKDIRFHDLRHTAATRLVQGHMPLSEVGRILGHTQSNTTYRYVNANLETARKAADVLASFNKLRANKDSRL
jgi:integrase